MLMANGSELVVCKIFQAVFKVVGTLSAAGILNAKTGYLSLIDATSPAVGTQKQS